MGSKNCAETPRQKMIGMMYLFLTAMLALNVSSEVLNGFTRVDESLRSSAQNIGDRNTAIMEDFKNKEKMNPMKVAQWREKAQLVNTLSDSLYEQIDEYKLEIVRDVDGPTGNPDSINAKDNLDAPERVMLLGGKNSKGAQLKEGINNYRASLIDIMEDAVTINGGSLDTSIINSLNASLTTPMMKDRDGEEKPWEQVYFSWMPVAASVALLSKLQNDVRDAESQVIQFLLRQIDAKDFKVNKVEAHIIPTSTSVIRGGTFSAQILLAGRDTTKSPVYKISENGNIVNVKNGLYEKACNQLGVYNIGGSVVLKDDDNNDVYYQIPEMKYEVVDPFATVSALKMNVLYAGVENPVGISAPGIAASDLRPSISNGSLKTAADGQSYIAIPSDYNRNAVIKVNAIVEGKETHIADYPFRVKLLPDPLPFIAYQEVAADANGDIKRIDKTTNDTKIDFRLLKFFKGIKAMLPESDFEVNYTVESFRIVLLNENGNNLAKTVKGSAFDSDIMDFLREFRGTITITEVVAKGPDNVPRNLPAIVTDVK
ncbi:gliding motility protein GldM [Saccharicrinis sp. FJH62]|uniref:type IX secretion system motor protein PorM/GldM n=1 Tax=Saccharicrinis sp. FJH62 TaxID=3344657 RepID=UPI0035D47A61